jgi:hypothetical protein
MMNTSTNSTRISAVFLSAVLIAGTIAALFPSFMIGAQADPYYGMDKDYKKVDKKISVSSLKCNNINVNVNGLTLDVFPPSLGILGGGDMAAEAADPTTDVASFGGSGGNDKSEFNNFKFVCINNNNNTVVQQPPVVPPVEGCEQCFTALNATNFAAVVAELEDAEGFTFSLGPLGPFTANSLEELCFILDNFARNFGDIQSTIVALFNDALGPGGASLANPISVCIAEALGIRAA